MNNEILVSVKNRVIRIDAFNENISQVNVFDISGKQIFQKIKIEDSTVELENVFSGHQILLVKIRLENKYITTKKIVF